MGRADGTGVGRARVPRVMDRHEGRREGGRQGGESERTVPCQDQDSVHKAINP